MGKHGSFGNDEILLIGDSNTYSGFKADKSAGIDPTIDVPHPRVLENRIRVGPGVHSYVNVLQDPLAGFFPNSGANIGAIGPALTFCRDYYVPNVLAANRNVRVTTVAAGGTTLVSGSATWGAPTGVNLLTAVTNINASIAQDSRNALKLILWTSGANDAIAGVTQVAYVSAWQALAGYLRSNITGAINVPILCTGLCRRNWPTIPPVWLALASLPATVFKVGYVDTSNVTTFPGQDAILYHFTDVAQRNIGAGFWTAYQSL